MNPTLVGAPRGGWQLATLQYVATAADAGKSLTVVLASSGKQDQQANWDNFVLTAEPASAVPEPGTWAMMVLGLGFVGAALRRALTRGAPVRMPLQRID